MREFTNARVRALKPSGIRKLFDIAAEMPEVISLGVGEPDFETPWHIREEGISSLRKGRTFYTSNSGTLELRTEISSFMRRKYGLEYDPKCEIIITVGGSEAIDITLRSVLEPGEEMIYPEPCFVSYAPCASLAGGVPVPIPLDGSTDFRLTPEAVEAAITPRTKVLFISFPNNPTGAIMSRSDLEAVARVAVEHDLFVLSDEIYAELSYFEPHVSIASLPGMRERTVVVNGFSKMYAMTGWRLGWLCGPAEIVKHVLKVHQFAIMCAPTTSQDAAICALRDGDEDIEMMRDAYDKRRRFLMGAFKDMGLPCFEPGGAFYAFPDISEFGMSSDDFCRELLESEHVAVVPGSAFGECGDGSIRISYAYSIDELREATSRMARFIERLRRR